MAVGAVAALMVAAGLANKVSEYPKADFNDHNIVYHNPSGSWVKVPPTYPDGVHAMPIAETLGTAREKGTITVLVASFRESRCPKTLKDLFGKAAHPERVSIGVVQQNANEDEDCLAGLCKLEGTPISDDGKSNTGNCKWFDQVRMIRMDASEAKGPVFARAQQIKAISPDDDYCMQIDAHTDAVQDWDIKIIEQWFETENEYAVITAYPTNVDDLYKNSNNHNEMPYNCRAGFSGNGKIRNAQANACANMDRPLLQPLWAAGLSFARCHAEWTVPQDPELKSVFTGEEFSRGARLWTAGYDFYALRRPVIGTYYGGAKGGHGSWSMNTEEIHHSDARMSTLLRWPGSDQSDEAYRKLGPYGLGDKRTLEQYAAFSGVDTINQKNAEQCIVQYVGWDWQAAKPPAEKAVEMQRTLAVESVIAPRRLVHTPPPPPPPKAVAVPSPRPRPVSAHHTDSAVRAVERSGGGRTFFVSHKSRDIGAGVVALLVVLYVLSGVVSRAGKADAPGKGRLEL